MYDTLIIGMGPAGIESAIYLKRFNKNCLVIGKDYGALEKAHEIENYYGLMPLSGKDLILNGIKQAQKLGVLINHDEVLAIEYLSIGFKVITKKSEYEAKTILIATGKSRNSFQMAKKYEGKGVSYCATCDGFFYRNKKIAVIGYNEYMLHELQTLLNLTKDITVFTNGNKLEVKLNDDIKVIEDKITNMLGEDSFNAIEINGEIYNFDGCFIALGSANAFSLAKHLGLEINNEDLVVNQDMMTNIPGIFAAGDVVGGIPQVVKAASDGAKAAYGINKFLNQNK